MTKYGQEVNSMIGAIVTKAMVRKSFGAFSQRNLDKFMEKWDENASIIYPNNLTVGGETKGTEAIKEWYRKDWEQFPEESFTVKNVCVENMFALGGTNVVTVEWSVKGKNRNREEFSNSGISVIHLTGGKVTLMRVYIFDLDIAKHVWGY
jgi:ketosteroid isomerase-like protein